jgi:hypothetical protein
LALIGIFQREHSQNRCGELFKAMMVLEVFPVNRNYLTRGCVQWNTKRWRHPLRCAVKSGGVGHPKNEGLADTSQPSTGRAKTLVYG